MISNWRHLMAVIVAAALVGTSSPAPAIGTNDLIDMAIELVDPDLKPLRPTMVCAAGGTSLLACASKYGQEKLAEDPDANRILHVYQLASSKQYAPLVAEFGVTAVCTSMASAPGVGLVCNEFAQELIAVGSYAAKQAGSIVGPAGKAALAWIGQNAGKFGCAIGFYCARESNPNAYVVDLGPSGKFALDKFDLTAIWQQDYAPRMGEAIQARLSDPFQYKQMLLPADTYLNRFMLSEQLGSKTINKLSGATTDGPVWLYKVAFAPFQKELNLRFAESTNQQAALRLEDAASKFDQNSGNWLSVMLAVKSEELFDSDLLPMGRRAAFRSVIETCRKAIDGPATGLWHWGQVGVAVGDTTMLNGKAPAEWAATKGWCNAKFATALSNDMAKRRKDFDTALALGCTRRPDGAKGLVCPALRGGPLVNLAGPMSFCQRAYKASAKSYCSAAVATAPTAQPGSVPAPAPTSPQVRVPGATRAGTPAPEPAPSPSPTLAPLRPKVRIPMP